MVISLSLTHPLCGHLRRGRNRVLRSEDGGRSSRAIAKFRHIIAAMLLRRFEGSLPLVGLAMGLIGCNASVVQRQRLESDYPLDRARAAVALAEAGDTNAVQKLVDLLEDDDRAVRLYAIL